MRDNLHMTDLSPEILSLFDTLFAEALAAGEPDRTAMTVASVDAHGQPSARITTGSERLAPANDSGPWTRSVQPTVPSSSRKRQCGRLPSASSARRAAASRPSAARS